MSAAREFADPVANRPTIVPVASKAEAVATLRNIAMSNDENRAAITAEGVIGTLVKLMTSVKHDDDNRSALSGTSGVSGGGMSGHSGNQSQRSGTSIDSDGSRRGRRRARNAEKQTKDLQVLDRKKLAAENRKLAEQAGQMLHTLILEGVSSAHMRGHTRARPLTTPSTHARPPLTRICRVWVYSSICLSSLLAGSTPR